MDPNTAQSIPSQPVSPQSPIPKPKFKRIIIIITVITIIIVILTAALIYSPNLFKNKPLQKAEQTQAPKPSPSSISKPVPNKIESSRGIITKIINNILTIKTATSSSSFDISKTKDFQKLVSGTLAGGDAKTASSSAKELKVNQEILVITLKESTDNAAAVLIIK